MEQPIDSFIEYLFIIEEGHDMLTADQVQKLQIIKTKVTEIVEKADSVDLADKRIYFNFNFINKTTDDFF